MGMTPDNGGGAGHAAGTTVVPFRRLSSRGCPDIFPFFLHFISERWTRIYLSIPSHHRHEFEYIQ